MDYSNIVKKQTENIDGMDKINSINDYTSDLSEGLSDNFTFERILESTLNGESIFSGQEIITSLKSLFLSEINQSMILGTEILIICIAVGMLTELSGTLGRKSFSEISLLVCTMIITGISVNCFQSAYRMCSDAVSVMVNTMEIISPVLITILISTGNIASGTIMSPMMTAIVTGTGIILKKIIMPVLFAATVLTLINCLTEKNYVNKLSGLLRKGAVAATGLILAVLSGVITVQGIITESSDGLLLSTAKYSMSTFIPIVGGFTSDTAELFIKCMTTIKGVVGVFGILSLSAVIIVPLLKVLVIGIIYKITAAAAEPLCPKKISDGLGDMGSCMFSAAAIMFFTSLLFIIFITIILGLGG